MKTEITPESKARFFALYVSQKVLLLGFPFEDRPLRLTGDYCEDIGDEKKVLLKPLSALSDEDAIEYFDILWAKQHKAKSKAFKIDYGKEWALSIEAERFGLIPFGFVAGVDFLRSRGYALPFLGISVEQQIEAGWIKLMTQ
jgi:hypothetical protein